MNRPLVLLAAILTSACSRRAEPPSAGAPGRPVVLATFSGEAAQPSSPSPAGLGLHPTTSAATPEFIFSERGGGVAWSEERAGSFRVFHNGRASSQYDAVGKIALSPDGQRCAFGALRDGKWRIVADGGEGATFSAIQEPIFSPDGAHLAYVAMRGERWYVVVDGKPNSGTPGRYGKVSFSGDSKRIAFVDEGEGAGSGKLNVTDLGFGSVVGLDGGVSDFVVNAARTRLAAVAMGAEGARVLSLSFERAEPRVLGKGYDAVYGLAFGPDGATVTYRGVRGLKGYVVLDGREEPFAGDGVASQAVAPGRMVVGTLATFGAEVRFHEHFAGAAKDGAPFDEAEGLVYSSDGRAHAYAARTGDAWCLVVNGNQGPPFDRVVTPEFSPDGKRVVYRARKNGMRFVVVADADARTIRQHPLYEQVFPVQFTPDGKSVAYGVKDGPRLAWKVEGL